MRWVLAVVTATVLTACSDDSASPAPSQRADSVEGSARTDTGKPDAASTVGIAVQVKVADGELRVIGDPCDGTGPYRQVHAGTAYQFLDESRTAVSEGVLTQGTAEKSMNADFGDRAEPSNCIWTVYVDGVESTAGLSLVIDGGELLPVVDTAPGESPKVLVV